MCRFGTGIALLLLLTLLLTQCGKKSDVIARVENQEIKVAELRELLKRKFPGQQISEISMDDRLKTLNELIDARLKTLKALDLGLDKEREFLREKETRSQQLIARKLFQELVIDSLVTEKLVRDYFDWKSTRIKAVAIWIAYRGIAGYSGERTRQEAQKLAGQIAEELEENKNPELIALQFSDDPTVEQNSGVMDPFILGRFGLEVDEKVFPSRAGEVAGPIDTKRGFLVVKIKEKVVYPNKGNFEEEFDRLRNQVYRSYFSSRARSLYREITEKFKKKHQAFIYEDAIEKFYGIIKEWTKTPQRLDDNLTTEQRNIVLAKVGERKITVGEFVDQFNGEFHKNLHRYSSQSIIRRVIAGRIDFLSWVIEGYERGYHKLPEIREELQKYAVERLAALFDRRMVQEEIQITDEEIRQYYERNKTKYREPSKIRIWEIAVKDKERADEIYKKAINGQNFKNLAQKYTEKPMMKNRGGDLGYLSKQAGSKLVVKKAFAAGPHKIVKPFKLGPYYYVIKTGDLLPDRQKDLKEVRETIERALHREKEAALREKKMQQIREEYSFRVNETLLRSIT